MNGFIESAFFELLPLLLGITVASGAKIETTTTDLDPSTENKPVVPSPVPEEPFDHSKLPEAKLDPELEVKAKELLERKGAITILLDADDYKDLPYSRELFIL